MQTIVKFTTLIGLTAWRVVAPSAATIKHKITLQTLPPHHQRNKTLQKASSYVIQPGKTTDPNHHRALRLMIMTV